MNTDGGVLLGETGLLSEEGWSQVHIVNESGVEVDRAQVIEHLQRSPEIAAMTDWANETRSPRRQGSIIQRDKYLTPVGLFEQFKVAERAAEHDDAVSGVLESTEGLAFSKMTMECPDPDQGSIWNQVAADLDFDSRFREAWRELFIYSQFVLAMYWGTKTYKVKGQSKKGIKRKKPFTVNVPLGMMMLDPYKVLPVGNFFFNQEKLAYLADKEEVDGIQDALDGVVDDQFVQQLMVRPYQVTDSDRKRLEDWKVLDRSNTDRLFLLSPRNVFRHTETRPQYRPFANCRMKSVFELLDIKAQLRQKDRAVLIGATNFIILIRKGSDQQPASAREVRNLQGYARTLAQVPMLIGDHRLSVDIVTPDQDFTLIPEKYNALDARISARLYQMFLTGNFAAGAKGDDSIKLARVVARGLESRRHQIKRKFEKHVFKEVVDSNPDEFDEMPDLRFMPKRIALDFDVNVSNFMLELNQNGHISRDTLLSEFDFSEAEEARKKKFEKESGLDDVFQSSVPFNSPQNKVAPGKGAPKGTPQTPAQNRRNGGTKGGAAPGTNQGKTKEQQADDDFNYGEDD